MEVQDGFECFCGERFDNREALIDHNVERHEMGEDESRSKVDEKYPIDRAM